MKSASRTASRARHCRSRAQACPARTGRGIAPARDRPYRLGWQGGVPQAAIGSVKKRNTPAMTMLNKGGSRLVIWPSLSDHDVEQILDVRQEGYDDHAADQPEQEIAEIDTACLRRRRHGVEHREEAAAEIRPQHESERDMQRDHLRRSERRREQDHREARIRQHREDCGHDHVQQYIASQRGKDHLDASTLCQRARGKHDELQ